MKYAVRKPKVVAYERNFSYLAMYSSRKYSYPEIPRGRVVSKVKIFKGKYEADLEFPAAGVQTKKPFHGRDMDIFWKNTLYYFYSKEYYNWRKDHGFVWISAVVEMRYCR